MLLICGIKDPRDAKRRLPWQLKGYVGTAL